MKKTVIGILAHVDAGKTTLSESLLYLSGTLRKMGRVDHKDAFLDTFSMERERGITIFSKQAVFTAGDLSVTLLDTPGHVDFSAEMERTLQVLDYAILVISAADGVQGHTKTLWRLLRKYKIPVFLFVNKMDQPGTVKEHLMQNLKSEISSECIDFTDTTSESFYEAVAMSEETVLNKYLETLKVSEEDISRLIYEKKIYPCYFGSALKMQGTDEFLEGLKTYIIKIPYGNEFGAKVFKVTRDAAGNRLTHLKITGGILKTRDIIGKSQEKINQIRIYSGEKFEAVAEASAGTICAVCGLSHTYPGLGLGVEPDSGPPVLEPVLSYTIIPPKGYDPALLLPKLIVLSEEITELHIVWQEQTRTILANVMGNVQIEVLKSLILERFGVEVSFTTGSIVYKETIADTVEGVGHFEPLRHYAEVHLLLEPLPQGSGLVFETDCSLEVLGKTYQQNVLSELKKKQHKGVLTGSELTDVKITLVSGRAHIKHTEGGDFREASLRAVRQGLMQAKSILLEPYYEFTLQLPRENLGRAMCDIDRMCGTASVSEDAESEITVTGKAPVSMMQNYQQEVTSYTKGHGKLTVSAAGYGPCHNTEEVIETIGYDPDADLLNPSGSVFCTHGAGYTVNWKEAASHMHLPSVLTGDGNQSDEPEQMMSHRSEFIGVDEIDEIINRISFSNKKDGQNPMYKKYKSAETPAVSRVRTYGNSETKEEYLLVDGYNVIFANKELSELASDNLNAASSKLMDILCNYQPIRNAKVICVFDAYKVAGHPTESFEYHNICVVYTKEAETADCYIEKFAHQNADKYRITVATSDGLEQIIIRSKGCFLLSARDFWKELTNSVRNHMEHYTASCIPSKNYLLDHADEETKKTLESIRNKEK